MELEDELLTSLQECLSEEDYARAYDLVMEAREKGWENIGLWTYDGEATLDELRGISPLTGNYVVITKKALALTPLLSYKSIGELPASIARRKAKHGQYKRKKRGYRVYTDPQEQVDKLRAYQRKHKRKQAQAGKVTTARSIRRNVKRG